ncbi:uncharacterized protein [Prorops nasuta]|uniref:uncharacterized protein n=1 Tax=Prorops nasuta TaxID=863751 RepID=UPI0034CF36A4
MDVPIPWIINYGKTWVRNSLTNITSSEGKENVSNEFVQRFGKLKIQETGGKSEINSDLSLAKMRKDLFSRELWENSIIDSPSQLGDIYGNELGVNLNYSLDSAKNSAKRFKGNSEKLELSARKINFQNELWPNDSNLNFVRSNVDKHEDEFSEPTRDVDDISYSKKFVENPVDEENVYNSIKRINANRREYNKVVTDSYEENERMVEENLENLSWQNSSIKRKCNSEMNSLALKEKCYTDRYLRKHVGQRPKSSSNVSGKENCKKGSSSFEQLKSERRSILKNISNNIKENSTNPNDFSPTYYSSLQTGYHTKFYPENLPFVEKNENYKQPLHKPNEAGESKFSKTKKRISIDTKNKLHSEKTDERMKKRTTISSLGGNRIVNRNSNVTNQGKLNNPKGKTTNASQPVWRPAGVGRIPNSSSTASLMQKRRINNKKKDERTHLTHAHTNNRPFANKQVNPSEPAACKKSLHPEPGRPMQVQERTTRMCKSLASTKSRNENKSPNGSLGQVPSTEKINQKSVKSARVEKSTAQVKWQKNEVDCPNEKKNENNFKVSKSIVMSRSCTIKNFSELINEMEDDSGTSSEVSLSNNQMSSSEFRSIPRDSSLSSRENSRIDFRESFPGFSTCSGCMMKGVQRVTSCKGLEISLETSRSNMSGDSSRFFSQNQSFSRENLSEEISREKMRVSSKMCKVYADESLDREYYSEGRIAPYPKPTVLYRNYLHPLRGENPTKKRKIFGEMRDEKLNPRYPGFSKIHKEDNFTLTKKELSNSYSQTNLRYERSASCQTVPEENSGKLEKAVTVSLTKENSSISINADGNSTDQSSLSSNNNDNTIEQNKGEGSRSENCSENGSEKPGENSTKQESTESNDPKEILAACKLAADKVQDICKAIDIYTKRGNKSESRKSENSVKCKYRTSANTSRASEDTCDLAREISTDVAGLPEKPLENLRDQFSASGSTDLEDSTEIFSAFLSAAENVQNICKAMEIYTKMTEEKKLANKIKRKNRKPKNTKDVSEDICDLVLEASDGLESEEESEEEDVGSLSPKKVESDENLPLCMVVESFEPGTEICTSGLLENTQFPVQREFLLKFQERMESIKSKNNLGLNEVRSLLKLLLSQTEEELEIAKRNDEESNLQLCEEINEKSFRNSTFHKSIIMSRDNLLPIVYGAVCSLMFWCLQFSASCES